MDLEATMSDAMGSNLMLLELFGIATSRIKSIMVLVFCILSQGPEKVTSMPETAASRRTVFHCAPDKRGPIECSGFCAAHHLRKKPTVKPGNSPEILVNSIMISLPPDCKRDRTFRVVVRIPFIA